MKVLTLMLLIFFISCGKETATKDNSTSSSRLLTSQAASSLYQSFPPPDQSLSINNLVGSTLTERKQGTIFCCKSGAVVPNPVYSYECWKTLNSGLIAQTNYQTMTGNEYSLIRVGWYGSGAMEKVNNDRSLLCQAITAVSPGAVSSYACYIRI